MRIADPWELDTGVVRDEKSFGAFVRARSDHVELYFKRGRGILPVSVWLQSLADRRCEASLHLT